MLRLSGQRRGYKRGRATTGDGMEPLQIERLSYAHTDFFHCQHCEVAMQTVGLGQAVHREQRQAAFPPDLQADYAALGDWARGVVARHGDRVRLRVVDAASLEGVYKSLRYRAHKYPAFVVRGEVRQGAPNYAALDEWIDQQVARAEQDAANAAPRTR